MAVGVLDAWSTTAGSNGSASSAVNFAEGQTPASLNNAARALMAEVKGWANQIGGAKTSGGAANVQTLTSDAVAAISAYAAGMAFVFKAGYSNSGACTLNVDGVGAKSIKKGGAQAALAANDIVAGGIYFVAYEASGDCFVLLNPESGQIAHQPLDATLTALAALSWSSGNALVQFTAADTVSLTLAPSVTSVTVSQGGSPSTPTLNFASATNYGLYYVTGDVGFAANGGVTASYNTARWQWFVPCRGPDGSASAPTWAYNNDTDCGFYRIGSDNIGFSLGGTKRMDLSTTLFDLTVPTRARMPRAAEASGTLTAASANKVVVATGGITINDGVFTADDVVVIYNDSASGITITQDTGMTLRFAGSTSTGNRTLAARGVCTIYNLSSTEAIISGNIT